MGCLFSLKQRATQSWGVQKLCQAETDAAECEAATEARQMGLFMVVTGFSCNNTYCTVQSIKLRVNRCRLANKNDKPRIGFIVQQHATRIRQH